MLFEPEAIERLSPAARVEVQDFYARKFLAARERRAPERRAANRTAAADPEAAVIDRPAAPLRWPRGVWFRNDTSRRPAVQAGSGRF
jgi:hypothetical protein